jgi:hypothetical protein
MGGRGGFGAALVFLGIIVSELRIGYRRRRPEAGAAEVEDFVKDEDLEDEDISLAEGRG